MLRQVLGVSRSELNVETLERLITNRVQESQHLDYKSESPKPNKEFAKDVAAMANGGGGVIIVGILDENNEPVEETPIPLANEVSRLQQVFNSNIHPFINIHWHEVRKSPQDSTGFLVMEIMPSDRVPFAVEEGDGVLGYYIRSGQHRHPLSEAQVEQMNRERFRRQSAVLGRLDALRDNVRNAMRTNPQTSEVSYFYLVSASLTPSARLFRPTRPTTRAIEEQRNHWRPRFVVHDSGELPRYVRPGFKRVEFATDYEFSPIHRAWNGWVEFHDDGSYVTVVPGELIEIASGGKASRFEDTWLTIRLIDRLVGYHSLASHFGFSGEVLLLAGIERQGRTILEWDPVRAELRGTYPLPDSVSTRLNIDISDLTPGPNVVEITKTLLDDLFTAFGWPECLVLSESGAFRSSYLGNRKSLLSKWADRFEVKLIDERATF